MFLIINNCHNNGLNFVFSPNIPYQNEINVTGFPLLLLPIYIQPRTFLYTIVSLALQCKPIESSAPIIYIHHICKHNYNLSNQNKLHPKINMRKRKMKLIKTTITTRTNE